jgi:N-acetylneuraminate synthase
MRLRISSSHEIGDGCPTFIIAEAGVNHNGSLDLAQKLIDAAIECKADAVKFQTFNTDLLLAPSAPKAKYQIETTGDAESQYDMLRRLELSSEAHHALASYCKNKGILFLSTPFDEESADLLEELGVPAFKISSGDLTNLPFLTHVGRKNRPVILSTGMANLTEVAIAVDTLAEAGSRDVVLLHCVSNYPAEPSDINLLAMHTLSTAFKVPVGYSDHTTGIEIALAAVALGARVLEKHITLDRNLHGPDHKASIEPNELAALVRGIRQVEASLGDGIKRPAPSELSTRAIGRKSLVAARDIPAGTKLAPDMISIKRPGTGLPPATKQLLVGRTVRVQIPTGTLFTMDMLM